MFLFRYRLFVVFTFSLNIIIFVYKIDFVCVVDRMRERQRRDLSVSRRRDFFFFGVKYEQYNNNEKKRRFVQSNNKIFRIVAIPSHLLSYLNSKSHSEVMYAKDISKAEYMYLHIYISHSAKKIGNKNEKKIIYMHIKYMWWWVRVKRFRAFYSFQGKKKELRKMNTHKKKHVLSSLPNVLHILSLSSKNVDFNCNWSVCWFNDRAVTVATSQ